MEFTKSSLDLFGHAADAVLVVLISVLFTAACLGEIVSEPNATPHAAKQVVASASTNHHG